jgi:hypothetical protein
MNRTAGMDQKGPCHHGGAQDDGQQRETNDFSPRGRSQTWPQKQGRGLRRRRRGDIPTIKIGRLFRVPVKALDRMLDSTEAKR